MEQLSEQAIAQIVLPIEVSNAIVAPDVKTLHQQQIAALSEQYADVKVNGVDDKAGFDEVQKAITAVTKIATGIDKTRKEITAPWDVAKKTVDKYAGELEEQVRREVLKPLADQKQWVITERERIEREAIEAAKAKIEERKSTLFKLGFVWNGQYVHPMAAAFGPITTITGPEVSDLTDEDFERMMDRAAKEVSEAHGRQEADAKDRQVKAGAAQAEAKRQQEIAANNDRIAKELADKQAAIDLQLTTSRKDALVVRGMVEEQGVLRLRDMSIKVGALAGLTIGEFDTLCRDTEDERIKWEAEVQEADRNRKLREHRQQELVALGMRVDAIFDTISMDGTDEITVFNLHEHSDEEFAAMVAKAKADAAAYKERIAERERELAAQEKAAEAERIRNSDTLQMQAMIHHLEDMPWPAKLTSAIAEQTTGIVRERVKACLDNLKGTIEKHLHQEAKAA